MLQVKPFAQADIKSGVIFSIDNSVIADATGNVNTTVNISGGTIIGNIETSGWASVGIYA